MCLAKNYIHKAVMKNEVMSLLKVSSNKVYFDATLGGGGHSREILERGGIVIATDLDDDAIENAELLKGEYKERFFPVKGNFKDGVEILKKVGFERVDGVVADLGLSSNQIENGLRGFSFIRRGPLDMRFDRSTNPVTAYSLLQRVEVSDLATCLRQFADICKAERIAQYIKEYFVKNCQDDTVEFANYLRRCKYIPKSTRIDPVTKIFMAIRMMVNDEINNLKTFLLNLPFMMKNDSVALVITFHSAEDRITKNIFRDFVKKEFIAAGECNLLAKLINKKIITPSAQEVRDNPRSRSAKLRGIHFFIKPEEV
ncbi:MAG: 16S rRNA (cytosine(1402)-N(4))-methyltransferase RsmH [Deltaproteobacteria bacterium]|nr:16S rRNA (cytosine(1402)-N(4))-methyltransferase RsmH [Deltaproteobacteria bacterium]